MKRGKDFIWISDNETSGTCNICVYTYSGNDFPKPEEAIDKRDSVMRENIPGDTLQMFMTTERHAGPTFRTTNHRGQKTMEMRGLWTMNGDTMGGPFVSYSIIDNARQRIIVAEGFVYAPETTKRDKIKQLEAVLYTLL